jgi:acetyl-CoA acetyltransferase family protein
LEALGGLRRAFYKEHGRVTPGNACPITDGAVALLVGSEDVAASAGAAPLGRLRAFATAGVDPARMGLGPVHAIAKLLDGTSLTLADVDLIEINEAFAAQVIGCRRAAASAEYAKKMLRRDSALGDIPEDKLNVNGGAVALGHPVGASGARLVLTLLKELRRRGKRRGIASLCVGGGQGVALLVESA